MYIIILSVKSCNSSTAEESVVISMMCEGVIGNTEDEVSHVMEYQHLQVSIDDKTWQIIIM